MRTVEKSKDDRAALCFRLARARARTDALLRSIPPASLYERPIPERHRLVFYLGHLEAFEWNLLGRDALGLAPFHREFDSLFAFGIDPTGDELPSDRAADWPRVREIEDYNRRVRKSLDSRLQDPALESTLLHVVIEHRLMHAETLAYQVHQLPLAAETLSPRARGEASASSTTQSRMVTIPAGDATLGQTRAEDSPFGWDNEFEQQRVTVPAFAIESHPVTNRRFLEFVRAGGYDEGSLWSEEAWRWKTARGLAHPRVWVRRGDLWTWRTPFAEIPLPPEWPVYVSHAEASAFARWVGRSLPTEGQWHRAAYGTRAEIEREYPWGDTPPRSRHGNFDFQRADPTPVDAHPEGNSAFGVADLVGNGWEWTSTRFGPHAGFEPHSFYPTYSADFFDGRHYVLKGGSPQTAACLLRRSFRNWFQPHFPYVYATFRCVES
jgi:ergothioneine biosynthesis protein EgtB